MVNKLDFPAKEVKLRSVRNDWTMKKIVLISANPSRFPYPVYPLGLGYLAQACQDAGHEAIQMDIQQENFEIIQSKIEEIDQMHTCTFKVSIMLYCTVNKWRTQ